MNGKDFYDEAVKEDVKKDVYEVMADNQFDDSDILELDEDLALKSIKPENSLFKRFLLAITDPTKLFEDVDQAPKVLFPLIVVALFTVLISFLNMDAVTEVQRTALINTYNQQGLEIPSDGFESILASVRMFTVLVSGITVAVTLVIKGVVSNLLAGFFSSEGSVKKIISGFLYAYAIVLFGSLLGTLVSNLAGIGLVSFSPAMVLGMDAIGTPLYTILSALDIFTLWYLWVSAIGLKIIKKVNISKGLICVLVPYLVTIAFSVLIA